MALIVTAGRGRQHVSATATPRSRLSREAQLLLLAGQNDGSTTLNASIDWSKLIQLAQEEGATPVVWQWLQHVSGGNGELPRSVASEWRKLAMVSEFQMVQLERSLNQVLDLLANAGIEAMLLKGAALAHTVYRSFAERPMSDLDLLLRPDQAPRAWAMLQTHGWHWPAAQWPAQRYVAHQHLPPLIKGTEGGGARLEIHSALLPAGHPLDWPIEGVWERATRVPRNGREVLVPDPVDQLLYVCVHFAWSHEMRWGGWRALRDVAAISQRGAVPWQRLVAAARETRARTCCYWTLRLSRTLAGANVPDHVLQTLRPPRPERLLRWLEQHYVLQVFSTERCCPSEAVTNALWSLGIAPRWSGHGAARPWQISEQWIEAESQRTAVSPWRRALNRSRHAFMALGYLRKLSVGQKGRGGRSPRHA